MDNFGYIYTFWDKKLKRYIYVGQTDNFKRRMGDHLRESKKEKPYQLIEIEIMEYGINNYDIHKMQFPISELNNKERYFIRYFQTREYYGGCNLTDGGEGTRGYKWSEESKRKKSTPKFGKSLGDLNPEFVKQWHLTKNGNLTPFEVTPNSHKKVWWICEKGHEWEATIHSRNNGKTDCPYCSGNKTCIDNCLATKNPELAKQWHPTKNGNLTPYNVTCGTNKKVWWICEKGHEWKTRIADRNNGSICPYCAKENRKGEGNPAAKSYKITSPNNEIFIIKGTLEKFCNENDLCYAYLYKKIKSKDNYKGWKIEYFNK